MATDKQSKRRTIKKTETIREKQAKAGNKQPKKRQIKKAASKLSVPFSFVFGFAARILRPFRFVLRPFKTRPMKFTGRLLYKILGIGYFRNSWRELREVKWPSRSETIKLTIAVFVFATAISLVVAVLDYGLDKIFKQLLT